MKYSLLLFLSLFLSAFACGQEYEEVEFEVKKAERTMQKVYLYKSPLNSYNSDKGRYRSIHQSGDTLYYYNEGNIDSMVFNHSKFYYYTYNPKRYFSDTIGFPYLVMKFSSVNDTVYADPINAVYDKVKKAICSSETVYEGCNIGTMLSYGTISHSSENHIMNRNVIVRVDGRNYRCIKIMNIGSSILKATVNGKEVKPKHVKSIYYTYLREGDFIPIKITQCDYVKRVNLKKEYPPIAVVWELYKVIE